MVRTICMAAVFVIASALAQAKDCSSGGECQSDDGRKRRASLERASLERASLDASLEEVERASGLETLFIVLSDSHKYSSNLRWIGDSWGKDLSSSQLLAIGDEANETATRVHVEPSSCPAHTVKGSCCKTGEAIIKAHEQLEKQPNLKWAFIVEDDTYVRPEVIDKQLKLVDPVGVASRGTLVALHGYKIKECLNGVSGRAGFALSREAIATLVGDSPSDYLIDHVKNCKRCGMYGGMVLGTLGHARGMTIFEKWGSASLHSNTSTGWWSKLGWHGWLLPKPKFEHTLSSAVEPAMYHYMKKEGQFKFLEKLFAKQHTSIQDPRADHCAEYNGNTVCTHDPADVPWKLPKK